MDDTMVVDANASSPQDSGGVLGNDFGTMFSGVIDTLTNAYVGVTGARNATGAAPGGASAIKAQNPNTPPGLFGAFPQAQVNIQGNKGGSILANLTSSGMGLLVVALLALFFLRR